MIAASLLQGRKPAGSCGNGSSDEAFGSRRRPQQFKLCGGPLGKFRTGVDAELFGERLDEIALHVVGRSETGSSGRSPGPVIEVQHPARPDANGKMRRWFDIGHRAMDGGENLQHRLHAVFAMSTAGLAPRPKSQWEVVSQA